MNKAAIRKWVDALRSGEFTQGENCLHDGVKHCCLGVACEVYRRETDQGGWSRGGAYDEKEMAFVTPEDEESQYLPLPVQKWLGLCEVDPVLGEDEDTGCPTTASSMNDSLCMTFDQIADAVEKRFLRD